MATGMVRRLPSFGRYCKGVVRRIRGGEHDMMEAVILVAFVAALIGIALRIEIGARSRAWQRIAEERRWDWERRIELTTNRDKW